MRWRMPAGRLAAAGMVAALLVVSVVMSGCGDDDGVPRAPADVTGAWDLYSTPDGGGEGGPSRLRLSQSGSTAVGTLLGDPLTATISGSSVTAYQYIEVIGTWVSLSLAGTVIGGHVEGSYTAETGLIGDPTPLATETGTWRAELVTRALFDATGTWNAMYEYQTFWGGPVQAVLTMAPDGTVTGTYGGSFPVTGTVHGFDVTLTIDEGGGYLITVVATDDGTGTHADGTWSDTDGDSGAWYADKL